jgi:hypothetical protein
LKANARNRHISVQAREEWSFSTSTDRFTVSGMRDTGLGEDEDATVR